MVAHRINITGGVLGGTHEQKIEGNQTLHCRSVILLGRGGAGGRSGMRRGRVHTHDMLHVYTFVLGLRRERVHTHDMLHVCTFVPYRRRCC